MRHLTERQPRPSGSARTASGLAIATLSLAVLSLAAHASGSPGPGAAPQLGPATPASFTGDCASLQATLAGIPNTTITSAGTVAAGAVMLGGQPVAAHCRVLGTLNERTGTVDGRA